MNGFITNSADVYSSSQSPFYLRWSRIPHFLFLVACLRFAKAFSIIVFHFLLYIYMHGRGMFWAFFIGLVCLGSTNIFLIIINLSLFYHKVNSLFLYGCRGDHDSGRSGAHVGELHQSPGNGFHHVDAALYFSKSKFSPPHHSRVHENLNPTAVIQLRFNHQLSLSLK